MIELLESRIAPATFIVTNLSDSGPGSLREAIALANDRSGADVVIFKPGLTGQIDLATGEMLISDPLTIRGPGPDKLAIDGQGVSRIFNVRNVDADANLTVSGLTFQSGDASSDESGGAILSVESLIVKNCVFAGNDAARQGGAIAVFEPLGDSIDVQIRQSSFFNNLNGLFGGGAVNIEVEGNVVVKQCVFNGNSSDTRAGALSIGRASGGFLLVEKCQFLGNRADEHGALGISNGDGTAILRGNVFTGNRSTEGTAGAVAIFGGEIVFDRNMFSQNSSFQQGGGLFTAQFTSLTISHSRFLDNAAQLSGFINTGGGALSIGGDQADGSTARIIGSIFSGNSSTKGGGIFVAADPFLLKIIATTIANNRSGTEGGGIFVEKNFANDSASIEVSRSTITGNTALNLGGGVYSDGDGFFTLKSSKVTSNVGAAGGGLYLANTTKVLISGSLIAKNLSETVGGGIAGIAELELSSSRVLGNTAKQFGGGIHSLETLLITGSTISGNFSFLGAGVFQQSSDPLTITKSKVRGNISHDQLQVVDL